MTDSIAEYEALKANPGDWLEDDSMEKLQY